MLAFAVGLVRGWNVREGAPASPEPPVAPLPASSEDAPAPSPATRAKPAAPEPVEPNLRQHVRQRLEADLAAHFPDRKLSSDELDAAADALLRLRAARLELNALPRTQENAVRIRELVDEIGRASSDFEYLTDVDPITFTERASRGFDPDEEEEEP